VPDGKTAEGRRLVPMSSRVFEILRNRCTARQEGWVFPSKRSASGHLRSICNLFRKARNTAGLPKELVLYCARHDYGTRVLMRTGNLAAVMKTMAIYQQSTVRQGAVHCGRFNIHFVRLHVRLEVKKIVHRMSEILFAAELPFRCLDRGMPE
jgi:integrase